MRTKKFTNQQQQKQITQQTKTKKEPNKPKTTPFHDIKKTKN